MAAPLTLCVDIFLQLNGRTIWHIWQYVWVAQVFGNVYLTQTLMRQINLYLPTQATIFINTVLYIECATATIWCVKMLTYLPILLPIWRIFTYYKWKFKLFLFKTNLKFIQYPLLVFSSSSVIGIYSVEFFLIKKYAWGRLKKTKKLYDLVWKNTSNY